ncbi:acyltransferase family protein [uncultured Prevotella sp.]|uniref:acyltransferase family protein n=1 Tax=uncultured Prevotella sp. TaxID=159272 RepID=UPI00258D8450|nr:acyltransferase family protein [uncultured Prevotella sp.]
MEKDFNNTTSNRILLFDAMKCFAIFLVIWGHCIGQLTQTDFSQLPMYRIIYSFHMPLFMLISGYFASNSMHLSLKPFLVKKFRQLIYPCIIWGFIIWFFIESVHSFRYNRDSINIWGILMDFYWFADFWFLKSCFICYFLAYIGFHSRLSKKYWIPLSLIISQGISPFFISFMYPCFIIGLELHQNKSFLKKIKNLYWGIAISFLIMLFFYTEDVWNKSHGIPSNILNADFLTWIPVITYRLFRLLIGIIGSVFIFLTFSNYYSRITKYKSITYVCYFGRYTLEIYILQAIILERIIAQYLQFNNVNQLLYNFVITPVIAITILLSLMFFTNCIYYYRLIGKILFGAVK